MVRIYLAAFAAAVVAGTPVPQGINTEEVLAAAAPTPSVALGVLSQVVTVNIATLIAAAAAEATSMALASDTGAGFAATSTEYDYYPSSTSANILDYGDIYTSVSSAGAYPTGESNKQSFLDRRGACTPQALGSGPVPSPDTAIAFSIFTNFTTSALNAVAPAGYVQTFSNLGASSNALGYMGFITLPTYSPQQCATSCNGMSGCTAINIFFERDPIMTPGSGCDNPASTTMIKCVFWGGPVTSANTVNTGYTWNQFQTVIAGSNGYVSSTVEDASGYTAPLFLGTNAIDAPADCNGASSYLGDLYWTDGKPFDAARCSTACTAYSNASTGANCQFFNTYIISKNNIPQGQYCAMYNETWDATHATYTGFKTSSTSTSTGDVYTIQHSFSYTNSSNPGVCVRASSAVTVWWRHGSELDVKHVKLLDNLCIGQWLFGCFVLSAAARGGNCYMKSQANAGVSNSGVWGAKYVYNASPSASSLTSTSTSTSTPTSKSSTATSMSTSVSSTSTSTSSTSTSTSSKSTSSSSTSTSSSSKSTSSSSTSTSSASTSTPTPTSTQPPNPSCTSHTNVLTNGGFESGSMSPWTDPVYGSNKPPLSGSGIVSPGYSSNYGLAIIYGTNGGGVFVEQRFTCNLHLQLQLQRQRQPAKRDIMQRGRHGSRCNNHGECRPQYMVSVGADYV